jgi:hypothetical protein
LAAFDQIGTDQGRLSGTVGSALRSLAGRNGAASSEPSASAAPSVENAAGESQAQVQAPAASNGTPARTPAGGFYISPNLAFDARASTVIFQVRDPESGDVTRQFPAESAVERYRRDPSRQPFVLPEPTIEDEGVEPAINARSISQQPVETELATGPSNELPDPVSSTVASGADRADPISDPAALPISSQSTPVDILA